MPVVFLFVRQLERRRPRSLLVSFARGPTVKKHVVFDSNCSPSFFLFLAQLIIWSLGLQGLLQAPMRKSPMISTGT